MLKILYFSTLLFIIKLSFELSIKETTLRRKKEEINVKKQSMITTEEEIEKTLGMLIKPCFDIQKNCLRFMYSKYD